MVVINLNEPLTLGKLREIVNDSDLSSFPDNSIIFNNIGINRNNVRTFCIDNINTDPKAEIEAPIVCIIGTETGIEFYNYNYIKLI